MGNRIFNLLITSVSRHCRHLGKFPVAARQPSVHVQECLPKRYSIVTQFVTLADEVRSTAVKRSGPSRCVSWQTVGAHSELVSATALDPRESPGNGHARGTNLIAALTALAGCAGNPATRVTSLRLVRGTTVITCSRWSVGRPDRRVLRNATISTPTERRPGSCIALVPLT